MDKENLIRSISEAFKNVPRPTHRQLFRVGWETYDRKDEALTELTVQHWQVLSSEKIQKHKNGLMGLAPEWFVFLLPAFLISDLKNLEETNSLTDTIQYCIKHPILFEEFTEAEEMFFLTMVMLLDGIQCRSLSNYMRYQVSRDLDEVIYDDSNIRMAIQYWDKKAREKS